MATAGERPHAVTCIGSTASDCAGGTRYTYDANGNLLNGAGWTIAWSYDNQPSSITRDDVAETYTYRDC
jgi:hypothetical protein